MGRDDEWRGRLLLLKISVTASCNKMSTLVLQEDVSVQWRRPEDLEVTVHRHDRKKEALQGNLKASERKGQMLQGEREELQGEKEALQGKLKTAEGEKDAALQGCSHTGTGMSRTTE